MRSDCAQLAPPPHLMRGAASTALGSLPLLSCFAAVPTGSGWLGFSIGARGRIDGVLGGSGARTKYTANGMPQTIEVLRVRRSGVSQNDPPTNGMRGMIEGLLGRRTGVSRGRRLHHVGRNCPLLRIGRRSTRKRLVRLLSYGRGAGCIILGDPSPNRRFAHHLRRHIASRSRELRRSDILRISRGLGSPLGRLVCCRAFDRERAGRRRRSWLRRDRGGGRL
jgi:hypothetical protein